MCVKDVVVILLLERTMMSLYFQLARYSVSGKLAVALGVH
jgi:hypothetical protein